MILNINCAAPRQFVIVWAVMFLAGALAGPGNAAPRGDRVAVPNTLITDGSFVHDVGQLWMNITNFGLIGSQPGSSTPYSHAPSAEWPAGSGIEHLWGAGLWVGAMKDGAPHVSTGQFETELMSTQDPLDVIFRSSMDAANAARYPSPNYDDDLDGMEDEDPLNALDDDQDNLIDEDYGAIGNQYFRASLRDDTPLAQASYPNHVPLGIEIIQESFQWADQSVDDFVGFRYTITNDGVDPLEDVFLGLFMDADVGPREPPGTSGDDDLPWYLDEVLVAPDGSLVPVNVATVYDADGVEGMFGVMILDHTTDPAGSVAPVSVSPRSVQFFAGNVPFDQGGDPTNDAERYDLLSRDEIDTTPPLYEEGQANDYRALVSVGPFGALEPGQSLTIDLAFVVGMQLEELREAALQAALTHRGAMFDRDGDPQTGVDGKEYHVPWLFQPTPVPVVSGSLRGVVDEDAVLLEGVARSVSASDLAIVREATASATRRSWIGSELDTSIDSGAALRFSLRDDDAVGWPRSYVLRSTANRDDHELARIEVTAPMLGKLALSASPNPFNPRVSLSYDVPEDGLVSLVVYDLRGRVVRRLVEERQMAGPHQVLWDGRDEQSRTVSSGVYQAQLEFGGRRVTERLALLR